MSVQNLNITTQSRPIRYAFLVDLDQTDQAEIDEFIKRACSVWGGRFAPVIPAKSDSMDEWNWNFLVGSDPDIIITNFLISDVLLERMNRNILPLKIIESSWKESEKSWTSYWQWEGISTARFPELVAGKQIIGHPPQHLLIERNRLEGERYQFILQNFGITSDEFICRNYWDGLPSTKMNAEDTAGILNFIAKANGGVFFPLSYSETFAQANFDNEYCGSTQELHLVVGDSFHDRLYAWNRKLLGRMNCGGITTIWIPSALLEDSQVTEGLSELIRRRFFGYNNSNIGSVVSYSLSEETLKNTAEKLRKGVHISLGFRRLAGAALPKGKPGPLMNMGKFEYQSRTSSTVGFNEDKAIISTPRPNFITDRILEHGTWMAQIGIQYHPDRSLYMNVRPTWDLPKKVALADLFFEGRQARTDSNSWLATIVKGNDPNITVKIPDDREILIGTVWQRRFNLERNWREVPPMPKYLDFPVSEEGKSINGVVKLFGDLQQFGHAFRDVFWREIFFEMGKRSETELNGRTELVAKKLGEFIDNQQGTLPTEDSDQVIALAREIAKSIRPSNKGQQFLRINDFRDRFNILRNKPEYKGEFYNRPEFNDEMWGDIRDLKSFMHSSIIFQGCHLTCRYCKTQTWLDVDHIKSKFECEGCLSENYFPLNPDWHYRLNPFLINLLQERGGYVVARALYALQDFCRGMFFFMPPFDVCSDDDNERLTDVDIYVIRDGKLILGDVKATPTGFIESKTGELKNLSKLRTLVDLFRPNEFVFASECETFPPNVLDQVNKFKDEMKAKDVEVKVICLNWQLAVAPTEAKGN